MPPPSRLFQLPLQSRYQPRKVLLGNVVLSAGAHRVDRRLLRHCPGHHDERDVQPRGFEHLQRLGPAEIRQTVVGQHNVRLRFGSQRRLQGVRCLHRRQDRCKPIAPQVPLQQFGIISIVFYKKDLQALWL